LKILRQFGLLLFLVFFGEFLRISLNISVPGNIIGMIILLVLLILGIVKVDSFRGITKFLLDHMIFFFIPAGVSLLENLDLLKGYWISIILICLISTILVVAVTGLTVQLVKRCLKL
jgi:holin-like protein